MFRLLMPHNPGKEADYSARFPENQRREYYPKGWRFLWEQRPDLACPPLAIPSRREKGETCRPRQSERSKKELRKRNGGNPSVCTYRSALHRSPEGWAYYSATVACICCPCVGREKSPQEGVASLPLSAKSPAGARRLHPTFSSDMAGSVRQVEFSRPARYFGHFTWKTGWKL